MIHHYDVKSIYMSYLFIDIVWRLKFYEEYFFFHRLLKFGWSIQHERFIPSLTLLSVVHHMLVFALLGHSRCNSRSKRREGYAEGDLRLPRYVPQFSRSQIVHTIIVEHWRIVILECGTHILSNVTVIIEFWYSKAIRLSFSPIVSPALRLEPSSWAECRRPVRRGAAALRLCCGVHSTSRCVC